MRFARRPARERSCLMLGGPVRQKRSNVADALWRWSSIALVPAARVSADE